jgi:hypothetical protein
MYIYIAFYLTITFAMSIMDYFKRKKLLEDLDDEQGMSSQLLLTLAYLFLQIMKLIADLYILFMSVNYYFKIRNVNKW